MLALWRERTVDVTGRDFSSWDYFEQHGKMLPDDWKDQIGGHIGGSAGTSDLARPLRMRLGEDFTKGP